MIDGKQIRVATVSRGKLAKDEFLQELATPFVVATTTLADITGLGPIALKAGSTYLFEFSLGVSQATAASLFGCAVNYTGTVTRLLAAGELWNAATANVMRAQTANNTAMIFNATQAAATGPLESRVRGSITVTTAGNLTIRAQRSVAATTIVAGSSGWITEI